MASTTSSRSSALSSARRARHLVGAGLLAALPALMGAEGGCTLLQATLESPVQAITILREHADGSVDVDLMVINTAEWNQERFITTVQNAEIRMPGGELVALEQEEDGHYRADSQDDERLVYEGGGVNYRITFEVSEEDAGEAADDELIAVVQAPEDEVTFELTKKPDFAGDTSTVEWTPSHLEGLLEVRNERGEIVFSTFDLSTPEIDGSKWGSLIHGGRESLPVDVFADAGSYTISFCAVRSQEGFDEELSAGLGVLSGFLAGRCVEDVVIEVAE
jgi:hypothetical protein